MKNYFSPILTLHSLWWWSGKVDKREWWSVWCVSIIHSLLMILCSWSGCCWFWSSSSQDQEHCWTEQSCDSSWATPLKNIWYLLTTKLSLEMSVSPVICATISGGLSIFCWATNNPVSVTNTSSQSLSISSSLPSSVLLRKWTGRVFRSLVISGRNADLKTGSVPGSSAPPPAPLQAETGSGGTRAQKWPRV